MSKFIVLKRTSEFYRSLRQVNVSNQIIRVTSDAFLNRDEMYVSICLHLRRIDISKSFRVLYLWQVTWHVLLCIIYFIEKKKILLNSDLYGILYLWSNKELDNTEFTFSDMVSIVPQYWTLLYFQGTLSYWIFVLQQNTYVQGTEYDCVC